MAWTRRAPRKAERERVEAVAQLLLPVAGHSAELDAPGGNASRVFASYLPFPTWGRARLLLPLITPAAASAGLGFRTPTGRRGMREVAYGLAGWALRTGLLQRSSRPRVHLRARTGADVVLCDVSLAHRVSELVGGSVHLAARVGGPDPHRTVTMHAVADDGRLVAFVKVTRSALSCGQLSTEARALEQLPLGGMQTVEVPRLIHHGHWNGMGVLVVSPMDLASSEQPTLERPPDTAAMLEVAASGAQSTKPLGESVYWSRTRQRLLDLRVALPTSRETWQVASDLYEGLASAASRTVLDFGAWHGDWLPWNLSWRDGRLLTWDWEYWSDCVPVGFDMLHFYGGTMFFRDGADAGEALRMARSRGGAVLEEAGFEPATVDLVHALYVLEFLLRRLDIAAHGGGLDDRRVFPSLLPVAFEALAQASAVIAQTAPPS